MKYILLLVICAVFIVSCDNNKNYFLNTNPLSIGLAKKNGYEKVKKIDLLVFNKQVADTLVGLEFDNTSKRNYLKTWRIKLDFNDIKQVRNILLDYDLIPITEISYWENNTGYSLTLIRNSDNNVFICDVKTEQNVSHLYISYHIPR